MDDLTIHETDPDGELARRNLEQKSTLTHILSDLLPEWTDLFRRKHAGYGDMHRDLGLRAQYVDIHRKVGKLRRAFWDGASIGAETPREVLLDLIGHCFLTIDLIDREKE